MARSKRACKVIYSLSSHNTEKISFLNQMMPNVFMMHYMTISSSDFNKKKPFLEFLQHNVKLPILEFATSFCDIITTISDMVP